jgi:hypothetical protein
LGNDGVWKASQYLDYELHNRAEMLKTIDLLKAEGFDQSVIPGSYFQVKRRSRLRKLSRKITSLLPRKV